ncbi:thiosulfate sulfurtransferase GlpE [Deinococcus xinjiangensis]|uniref:Thiosulfate sulfurtransferase GlpE n=1 Tax=Deinococcus xinjiangensis TaxID=457454 RepID=A0ABP9VAJ0_9DEIO
MSYTDLYAAELAAKLRAGAKLYDVRERDEYLDGHLPQAINLPLSELQGRENEIESPAIMVCLSGGRSAKAASHLAELGKADVMNLVGGTAGWRREGREIKTGEQP